jgi:hypothetical protein
MNQATLSYVNIRYEAPIMYFVFIEGTELGFPEMRELVYYAEKLSNGSNYVVLSDIRNMVKVTHEGKKYALQAKNAPYHKGTAVLVNNSALSLATNIFMGLKAPEYPYKAFTDEENAVDWLLQLDMHSQTGS